MLNAFVRKQIQEVSSIALGALDVHAHDNEKNLYIASARESVFIACNANDNQVQDAATLMGIASVALSYDQSETSYEARNIVSSLSALWNDYAKGRFNGPAFNTLCSYLNVQ